MTETQKFLLRDPIPNYYSCSRKNYFLLLRLQIWSYASFKHQGKIWGPWLIKLDSDSWYPLSFGTLSIAIIQLSIYLSFQLYIEKLLFLYWFIYIKFSVLLLCSSGFPTPYQSNLYLFSWAESPWERKELVFTNIFWCLIDSFINFL